MHMYIFIKFGKENPLKDEGKFLYALYNQCD